MILYASDFFPPTPGDKKGRCIICGRETEHGHEIDFSEKFTMWSALQEGEVICEHCYTMARNQDYRRKSWVADRNGVRFLEKEEILPTLLEPPEPPFTIFITKSKKKQGFLLLANRVSYSRDRYFIAFEDQLVFVDRKVLKRMVEVARRARELKFSKTELLQGPKTVRWQYPELCEEILSFLGNPLWEVVVYAV